MEVIQVAASIEQKIALLESFRQRLNKFTKEKVLSTAIAEYDKSIAIAVANLKAKGEPVTIIEKLAKGECWQTREKVSQAEITYKAIVANIDIIKAQLMGFQSIYKHLDST